MSNSDPTTVHKEHAPPSIHDLDLPFPYSPTSDPTSTTPQSALDFFLKATHQRDVDGLKAHAEQIQREAYATWPYPCIRRWAFLSIKAATSKAYPQVRRIGSEDPSAVYLDLGCFVGTDLRKLVADGWNPERVIGSDLRAEWFDLGYKLYGDKDTCPIALLAGDVFDPTFLPILSAPTFHSTNPPPSLRSLTSLAPLSGHVRCISTFSFFHLFGKEAQAELAKKLSGILSPKTGSVIFGSHQGMAVAGNRRQTGTDELFAHSPETWKDLWEVDIFPASRTSPGQPGTRVRVWAELKHDYLPQGNQEQQTEGPKSQLMEWTVMVI